MIQRVQTIFFFLSAVCFFALFQLPFAVTAVNSGELFSDSVYDVTDNIALMGLCILGGILSLVALFSFRNRGLQIKLGNIVLVTAILLIVASILLFLNDTQYMNSDLKGEMQFGLSLPILALIFTYLAERYVKKDERLVRSADRLR